jgi:SpoVK/Ycf46/Vps4 family AAA+-type ATPase
MAVPQPETSGRSPYLGGTAEPAPPPDAPFEVMMADPLQRLGRILSQALLVAQAYFGQESAGDPFRGLYISADHAERALESVNDGLLTDVLPALIEPEWSQICEHSSRWKWLRTAYELSDFELDVVLIALAPDIDLRYEKVYGYLQDDVGQKSPTVDLALNLLCGDATDKAARRAIFGADAPLIRHSVLTLVPNSRSASMSLLASQIQLDRQIVDVLLGVGGLDPRLSSSCSLSRPRTDSLEDEPSAENVDSVLTVVKDAWGAQPLTLYFEGASGTGKRAAAESIAARLNVPLLAARAGLLPQDHTLAAELAILFREAVLQNALLFIDELDTLGDDDGGVARSALGRHLVEYPGVAILAGTGAWVPLIRGPVGVIVVPFAVPDVRGRRALWGEALRSHAATASPRDIDALASRFRFSATRIRDAVHTASNQARLRATHGEDATPTVSELFAAARRQSGSRLAALARRIEPIYRWDDIILPPDVSGQLHELCLRVAHRERVMDEWGFDRILSQGKGISALFAGPPGTGKTMAAEVIAGDLGVDLYKIDLSSVVSKYIGETEKNLERIFAAAPQANACLLFDEADAIFGKRSEVRDSHDRYANLEISYLLQRMEEYDGLAILTTNRRDHLDEAFTRRLQFIVEFQMPTEEERLRIWNARIPVEAPRDPTIDLEHLARAYPLPGANISNIALRAAYLAAADDSAITMTHLMSALRNEYRKMGRVVPAVDTDSPGVEQ